MTLARFPVGAFSAKKLHFSMNLHDCRENWCKRRLDWIRPSKLCINLLKKKCSSSRVFFFECGSRKILGRSWHRFLPWQLSSSIFAVIWFSNCFFCFAKIPSTLSNFQKHRDGNFLANSSWRSAGQGMEAEARFFSRCIGGIGGSGLSCESHEKH